MSEKDRLTLAAVAAVVASGFALVPLTQDRTYLFLTAMFLLASAGVAMTARRLVRNERIVHLLQLLPIVALPWLVPETRHPIELAADTVGFIQGGSAPMPFHTGFAVFCVLLLWLVYLVVEPMLTMANAPGWTFVPLITPFLITAVFGYFETSPWLFVLPAAGYGLLLITHARGAATAEAERYGQVFAAQTWRTGISRAGLAATIGAICVSLLVGLGLPSNSRLSTHGNGPAGVRFNDPSLDLIRNLNSTSDAPVITYQTTARDGVMLRLAALPILDASGFHPASPNLGVLPLPSAQIDDGTTVETKVTVKDFASEYLPVPWIPTGVDVAAADWRWDQSTLAVVSVASDPDEATRGLTYQAVSAPMSSLEELASSTRSGTSDDPSSATLSLPNGISPEAGTLVAKLIEGRTSPGDRAVAIRNYLRSDLFTYSTNRAPGSTLETLNDFLFGSRTGYCEQFAGAMAVLARIARIPSRVVVGFRPGTKTGDVWQVTPHDMHAWAELYFTGVGWVPVDATPAGAFAAQPTTSPSASASPSRASAAPTESASVTPVRQDPATPTAQTDDLAPFGVGALILFGLALVGFTPTLIRRLQRLRRLSGRGPTPLEDAWVEVWASARDRGVRWPAGSTRAVAHVLAPQLDEPASSELTALALATEKERYAPEHEPAGAVAERVATIRAGWEDRWPTSRSWLDRWWPRSLWPRSR